MLNKKRILIVDDEAGLGQMVKFNLEGTGEYEVRTETQGSQAIQAAHEFNPDLIFLDVVMPDMDGPEIASQLRKDPKLKNIPFVFLTATITPGELCSFEGAVAGLPFLAKPVCLEDLIKCVQQYINKGNDELPKAKVA